jgi:hypothetical protein
MARIDLDANGNFVLRQVAAADSAALQAARRATPDADAIAPEQPIDAANPFNVALLWTASLPWSEAAALKALDVVAPFALKQLAMYSQIGSPLIHRMVPKPPKPE